jgi:sulfur-oxidizing protein SoxY
MEEVMGQVSRLNVMNGTSRRQVLAGASIAAAAIIIAPHTAWAKPDDVAAEMKKLFAEKPMLEGKVKIDAPQIAENGLVVPINIEVDSPMTEADHVKAIYVFADGNPLPNVVTYKFTPACGKAAASTRMRLAQTQNVICVAEMSNGTLHMAKAEIKVTIGGCGG